MLSKKQRAIDYKTVFGTDTGKKVLKDIIRMCHVFSISPAYDNQRIIFREGERSVAIRILELVQMEPEDTDKLLHKEENYDVRYG